MVEEIPAESSSLSGAKMVLAFVWIISLVLVGYVGFSMGQGTKTVQKDANKDVLNSMVTQPPVSPTLAPQPTVAAVDTNVCAKSGYAQKWEFLTPYTVKEKDSVTAIAETELGDSGRANEVMQINGLPLVAGSTIYLPPALIKKSNGYLKQVHGRLLSKNESSWHLSFNSDEKGRGILIPSYWFDGVAGASSYQVGDCITVLFDEGFKVFSVSPQ